MKTRFFFPAAFLAFIQVVVYAQPVISLQKCLGGTSPDGGAKVLEIPGNKYIVFGGSSSNDGDVSGNHGSNYDFWLSMVDASGTVLSQKCFGGSGPEFAADIKATPDGGYIMCGDTKSNNGDVSGKHGAADAWVVKIDASWNIQWQHCYGGSKDDYPAHIELTADGGYIFCGFTKSLDGDVVGNHNYQGDAWIVKIDVSGNIQWQKCLGGNAFETANSIKQTADGNYVFIGEANSTDGDVVGIHHFPTGLGQDAWLIKLDGLGNMLWQKCFGGTWGEIGEDLIIDTDGGFAISARSNSLDGDVSGYHGMAASYTDVWVIKTDASGNILWQKCYGGSYSEYNSSICLSSTGNYIISAQTSSNDDDVNGFHGSPGAGYDQWLFEINSSTTLLWQKVYGGFSDENSYSVLETSDGNIVTLGDTYSNDGDVSGHHGTFNFDIWLVKIEPPAGNYIHMSSTLLGNYCPGTTISFTFTVVGTYITGNTYTIELSNNTGSFSSPTILDNFPATATGLWSSAYTPSLTLPQGNNYRIRVLSSSPPVTSDTTNSFKITCPRPTNLKSNLVTFMSATLKWGVVSCADKYVVQYKRSIDPTYITTTPIAFANINLTGLSSSTTYDWRVATACSIGSGVYSQYSPVKHFTTAPMRLNGSGDEITVYPNPAGNTVQITATGTYQYFIYSLQGEMVLSGNGNNENTIDINSLANGMYLINIQSDGAVSAQKLIIQH